MTHLNRILNKHALDMEIELSNSFDKPFLHSRIIVDEDIGEVYSMSNKQMSHFIRIRERIVDNYFLNVKNSPGCPFLVRDNIMRIIRDNELTTSFGSKINLGDQLCGFQYETDNWEFPDINIIFNQKEAINLQHLLNIYIEDDDVEALTDRYGKTFDYLASDLILCDELYVLSYSDWMYHLFENSSNPDEHINFKAYL